MACLVPPERRAAARAPRRKQWMLATSFCGAGFRPAGFEPLAASPPVSPPGQAGHLLHGDRAPVPRALARSAAAARLVPGAPARSPNEIAAAARTANRRRDRA